MKKISVTFEFDEQNLGEKWMNPDNLKLLLYSKGCSTLESLFRMISYTELEVNKSIKRSEKIQWKFKQELTAQGSSDGYITPEDIIDDEHQLLMVNKAVELLKSFEKTLSSDNLLNEF